MVTTLIKHKFFFSILFLLVISRPALAEEPSNYLTITGPCNLEFPKDHGAHPGYRTEWWYYTGNLHSETGDLYGFQLTFFRRQISPPGAAKAWPSPASAWRTQQIYLAHAAISDVAGKRHLQAELVSREALKMAGVLHRPPETVIYVKNWSARIGSEAQVLNVDTDEFSYELTIKPVKPTVLHGQAGYSLKGSSPERASCYYSFTRPEVDGRLTIGGKTVAVSGQGWMDHEFAEERVNAGKYFPSNFDKPHDVSLIANYKLTKRFSLSTNLTYQTGRPVTYPIGSFVFNGAERVFYSNRNEFRIPDYYRVDIGLNIEGNHKNKKLAHSFWNISIYNVLGRNNPYSVFFVTEGGEIKAYQSSIFSIPVPTITYNLKF